MELTSRVPTLVIEGNRLLRDGLKSLLLESRFEVRWESESLELALAEVSAGLTPELILIDGQDNYKSLVEGIRSLRQALPNTSIVVITHNISPIKLVVMLEAGVNGYLDSGMSPQALIQSLVLVMTGQTVFPTDLAQSLTGNSVAGAQDASIRSDIGLSGRDLLVVRCLASGDSNKMIANQLRMTEATVKVHLKSILRKLNLSNRTQAAIWAVEQGIKSIPAKNPAIESAPAGKSTRLGQRTTVSETVTRRQF